VPDIALASLRLTSPWDKERLLLVRATDAIRLCRDEGYQELPAYLALAWIDRLERQPAADVRAFVSRARLSLPALVNSDGRHLLILLRSKVRTGELAVIREGDDLRGDESDADLKKRRLVREIESKSKPRLSYRGRQYRLVVDAGLSRLANRDSYEVVSHRDAVTVLRGLAESAGSGGSNLGKLLAEATDMLSQDWRPPRSPDGLVLLRRIIVQEAYQADQGPALTPSQIKKLGKSDWIEVDLVDQDGEPYSLHYQLELVDQTVRKGEFDADGFLGVYEIESGSCTLVVGDGTLPAETSEAATEMEPEAHVATGPEEPAPLANVDTPPVTTAVPIMPAPELQEIVIRVVDDMGQPIAGLAVLFSAGEISVPVTTDRDGMVKQSCLDIEDAWLTFSNVEALPQLMKSSSGQSSV
jgi:hypothetical protein